MKKLGFLFVFLTSLCAQAQEERSMSMGQTTLSELQMTSYDKDPSAPAVVLYDEVNFFHTDYYSVKKRTHARDCYLRLKILKNEGLDKGSIIAYVDYLSELSQLKGITYNLGDNNEILKTEFDIETIITNEEEIYTKYIINFPNVKVGSVIELHYRISDRRYTPGIPNWYFQSDIPKIKSKLSRLTPKTTNYIVHLTGLLPITNQENIETVKCYTEKKRSRECRFASYEMEHVPAFKEEPLIPGRATLLSKLSFRLSYFKEQGYWPYEMMTDWKDFDKVLRRYYFDKEITKKSFFKRIIPDSIYNKGHKLTVAKDIYHFIQNHFTWNGNFAGDMRKKIRRNFYRKEASIKMITTALYNALQAANIECYYVAVSTRNRGPLDTEYPNFRDFDFTVIKAVIDGKDYFLDATNKSLAFGYVQPFASVKDGRVLDNTEVGTDDMGYEIYKSSYWQPMLPLESATTFVTSEFKFNLDKGVVGDVKVKRSGYDAFDFRSYIDTNGKQTIPQSYEDRFIDFDLTNYSIENQKKLDESVQEKLHFEQIIKDETNLEMQTIRFTPISFLPIRKNEFVDEVRLHPVDFVYPRNYKYRFTFNIPEGYDVVNLPKSARFLFPNNGGSYLYQIQKSAEKVRIFINLKMLRSYYEVEQYQELKKLFTDILALENTPIQLVKL